MSPLLFYREQAAREARAADSAILTNVRERCTRAAAAWLALAARIERADEGRAESAERRHREKPGSELEGSDASSGAR